MDGVSMAVKNYAYWLNRTLGPSSVITPDFPGYTDEEEFPVYRYFSVPLPMRPPYRLGFPRLDIPFQVRIRRQRFDLVHCHSPFSAARLSLGIAQARGIPIVASFHSKYRDDLQQALRIPSLVGYRLKRMVGFLKKVDEVWIPTESFIDTVRQYGYGGTIQVVPNGVDIDPPAQSEIANLKKKGNDFLKTEDSDVVFLYVGQLIWQKNLRLLLHALSHLKRNGNNFVMALIGEGFARRKLETLARDLNIKSALRFTGAIKNRQNLRACYARADLFLFPSLYDVAPLVVREAAAFRLPALYLKEATAARGVTHMTNGFLSGDSPEEYASIISFLMENPSAIRSAGEGAMTLLYQSWEDVLNHVKDRYLSLATAKTRSQHSC